MPKIAITTMPRSGSSYYSIILRMAYTEKNPGRSREGEWSQEDSWVIKVHEPILLLANIPDMIQTTILRNPIDNIASIVNKSSYGFGGSTIIGRPEIIEDNIKRLTDDKNRWITEAVFQETHMWMGYTHNLIKNINGLIPYTFEQLVGNEYGLLKSISSEINNPEYFTMPTKEQMELDKAGWKRDLANDINHTSGSANLLPTAKSEMYEEIKQSVIDSKYIQEALGMYSVALDAVDKRQQEYKEHPWQESNLRRLA